MKTLRTLFILVAVLALFTTGCENPASDDGNNGGGGDITINRSIQVTDAEGTEVGYLISEENGMFRIMTPGGFFASILITGELAYNDRAFYFSESNYSGECFYASRDGKNFYNRQTTKQFIAFLTPETAPEGTVKIYQPDPTKYTNIIELVFEEFTAKSYFKDWFNSDLMDVDYSNDCNLSSNYWGFYVTESTHEDATMLLNLTGPLTFTVAE